MGNTPAPHMILYHCNFGWPLVDEGTEIIWRGKCESRGMDMDNAVFNSRRNFRKCSKPIDSHRAGGEGCGFIDVKADARAVASLMSRPTPGVSVPSACTTAGWTWPSL